MGTEVRHVQDAAVEFGATRLTLLQPINEEYRTLLTGLLELYRKACRLKQDRRLPAFYQTVLPVALGRGWLEPSY